MHKLLLAASMLCMETAAYAEPSFYRGAGLLPCARFNQQLNANKLKAMATENYYFAWAQGYMSGLNETLEARMGRYRDLNSVSTDSSRVDPAREHHQANRIDPPAREQSVTYGHVREPTW